MLILLSLFWPLTLLSAAHVCGYHCFKIIAHLFSLHQLWSGLKAHFFLNFSHNCQIVLPLCLLYKPYLFIIYINFYVFLSLYCLDL